MGIDARLFAETNRQHDLRRLSREMVQVFGAKNFCFWDDDKLALASKGERVQQDGPDLVAAPGSWFIEALLMSRYYGPGYERGNCLVIVGVAEWLERNIGMPYYGGDSSGVCASLFDAKARRELMDHFLNSGHAACQGTFNRRRHYAGPFGTSASSGLDQRTFPDPARQTGRALLRHRESTSR